MNKVLRKCLVTGASVLMLASVGITASGNMSINARRVHTTNKMTKQSRRTKNTGDKRNKRGQSMKRIHRTRKARRHNVKRIRKNRRNQRLIKRYNHRIRNSRQGLKHRSRDQRIYKARFKRSNSSKSLLRSGFYDAYSRGGHFIFNKYAPDDKRAVVSKKANVSQWFQGTFGENGKYLSVFDYNHSRHGWVLVHKGQTLPKQNSQNVKKA